MAINDIYLAAVGVISAVLSGAGAWWSAKSAHLAHKSAEEAGVRNQLLAVVQIAKDCENTASRIRRLESDLGSAAMMSQVRRGVSQDSATDLIRQVGRSLTSQAETLCHGLSEYLPPKVDVLVDNPAAVHSALMKLTAMQSDLHRIRDELQGHLDKTQGARS